MTGSKAAAKGDGLAGPAREVAAAREGRLSALRQAAPAGLVLGLTGAASYAVGQTLSGAAVQHMNEPALGAAVGAFIGLPLLF